MRLESLALTFLGAILLLTQQTQANTSSKYFGVNVDLPVFRSIKKSFFCDKPQFRPTYSLKLGKKFNIATLEAEAFYKYLPMSQKGNYSPQLSYSANFKSYGILLNVVKELLQKQNWTLSAGIGGGIASNRTGDLKTKLIRFNKQYASSIKGKNTTQGVFQTFINLDYKLNNNLSLGMALKYFYLNEFANQRNIRQTLFNGKMHLGSIDTNIKYHF